MAEPLLASLSSIWVQPSGPNTKPEYLGCHETGDIEETFGDITPIYCPDPARSGKFEVVGSYQGEPGLPTVQVMTNVYKTADYLETLRCPTALFIHKVECGRRDVFSNYARSFIMRKAQKTGQGLQKLAVKQPTDNDASAQTFDFSAEELIRILNLTAARQTNAAVRDLYAIAAYNDDICAGSCGPNAAPGTDLVAVGAGDYAAKGVIIFSADGGGTWAASAADPFAVAEDITAVVAFSINGTTKRILVARGTADGANPAEVGYSDDEGATWTLANVGSVNGQYVTRAQGLFALDQYNIWLVTQDGYIYKSEDGGVTWAAQETGSLTTGKWNAIQFMSSTVGWVAGDNNEIAVTEDGGVTWTAVTGPAGQATDDILTLHIVNAYEVWIGFNDGTLYYTMNGGTTWTARTLPLTGLTAINRVVFINDLIGFIVCDTTSGRVLRTIDGGYTWELITAPTNDGLNDAQVIDANTLFVAGDTESGTAVILKVFAA